MSTRVAAAALPGALLFVLLFHSGGYFPSEWGLELLALTLVALAALLTAERLPLDRRAAVLLAGLAGLAVWTVASVGWSSGADAPMLAAERILVYLVAALALLLAVSRDRVASVLAGIDGAIVLACLWAVSTRLLAGPLGHGADALAVGKLAVPIGYANALGVLAAMAIVLTLGFAQHERAALRALAGGALIPLAAALFFTLSRGSVLALGAGLLAFVVAQEGRRRLWSIVLLAPAPILGVALAWRSPMGSGHLGAGCNQAAGYRLALELVALMLVGGFLAATRTRLARRLTRRGVTVVLVAACGAALWVGGAGGRSTGPEHRCDTVPPSGSSSSRLVSVSSSFRWDYWQVAGNMIARAPLLGQGAGSYTRWWLEERPVAVGTRSPHNLYLETLAELGPVGLALLVLALGAPLVAVRIAPRGPLPAAAFAAYVIWIVHAAGDWDWQVPAVALSALACASVLIVLARDSARGLRMTPRRRAFGLALLGALLAVGVAVNLGNVAAEHSESALQRGRPDLAIADAQRARIWLPWAAQPWKILGEAQLIEHQNALARRSLRRALSRDPTSWHAWYLLALASRGPTREDAIRRARERGDWDGNVYRPKSFRKPPRDKMH